MGLRYLDHLSNFLPNTYISVDPTSPSCIDPLWLWLWYPFQCSIIFSLCSQFISPFFIQTQEQFVLQQIQANALSSYGQKHGFSSIHSLEDFRRTQPMTTYADYEPYVSRVERGDVKAMLGDGRPPVQFGCSSGTTGRSKLIPMSAKAMDYAVMLGGFYGTAQEDVLSVSLLLSLSTFCAPKYRYTDSGIKIGSVMATSMMTAPARLPSTLPDEAMTISDQEASTYVGLLFGLRDELVERLDGSFASSMFTTLKFLEENWRRLVQDIRMGKLDERVNVTLEIREKLNSLLEADPDRAAHLNNEFCKGL